MYVRHFLGKDAPKGTHIATFSLGILGVKTGAPNRPEIGHKKFILLLFSWSYRTQQGPTIKKIASESRIEIFNLDRSIALISSRKSLQSADVS